jgi:hypothetical protein
MMGGLTMYPLIFLIMFISIGAPIILTLTNIALLFAEKKFKTRTINIIDITTFTLGILLTTLLVGLLDFHEWNEQLYVGEGEYTPISFESMPTFLCICLIAVVAYLLLRFLSKNLSPIIASLCYGGMFLGFCLTVVLTIQFWCDILEFQTILYLLFPYNYILCSIRLIRNTSSEYAKKIANTNYDNKLLQLCKAILSKSASFMIVSFLMAIPLLIVVIIILLLFGQQPDSIIKMFTETAEWTLSQKIPPPRLDYDGHYLCTVAACGDEKVVKPLRVGKRNNELIIVNRQLLIANAFEDLIAERTPKLHKLIRKTYNKLGLPISKYINTKRRSNTVYFIMKPLEWLFLLVLYTFDIKPENRIHRQYLG